VGKILERFVRDKLMDFLEGNGLLNDSQHGFRRGRSCLTNLLAFFNTVTKGVDEGKGVDVVYLDLCKAFDMVPHGRLVAKMRGYGVGGSVLGWIAEWLRDRKQRVVLNGAKSKWSGVTSGVPQGSVLGPILFVIYVNDLDEKMGGNVFKYADDTKIVRVVAGWEDSRDMQRDLDIAEGWAHNWKMGFNKNKCGVLHVGYKNLDFNYQLGGTWLENIEAEKDLGVIVSRDLKGHKQCLDARNRANRMLGIIRRNVEYKNKRVIRQLYVAYVRPLLEYSVQAWAPHYSKDVRLLEGVQRRATRLVTGLGKLEYGERLREMNLFSLERRRLRGDLIEVFKLFEGKTGVDIGVFFELEGDGRLRGHDRKLKKLGCKLDVRKYFFSNRIVDSWNKLPGEVVCSGSIGGFKRALDEYLDRQGMY